MKKTKEKIVWIIIILMAMCLFFPRHIRVELSDLTGVGSEGNTLETEDINVFLSLCDSDGYYKEKGELIYQYPNYRLCTIDLHELLWEGSTYDFLFYRNNHKKIEELQCSQVRIYVGTHTLYELSADNMDELNISTLDMDISAVEGNITFGDLGNAPNLYLHNVRKAILGRLLIYVSGYFLLWCLAGILCWKGRKHIYSWIDKTRIWMKEHVGSILVKGIVISLGVLAIGKIIVLGLSALPVQSHIKEVEIYMGMIALGIIYASIRKRTTNKVVAFGVTCLLGVPMYFTVANITSFYGCDEWYGHIREFADFANSPLRNWSIGEDRTSCLIMGTIMTIMPKNIATLIGISEEILVKMIHWLFGIIIMNYLVGFIHDNILDRDEKQKHNDIILTVLYSIFLLTPVYNLAMQNVNYDLFSMLFGVGAFVVCAGAWKKDSIHWAIIANIFAALAAQEKVLSGPVVGIAAAVLVKVYIANHQSEGLIRKLLLIRDGIVGTIFATAIQVLTVIGSKWWVTEILKSGQAHVESWKQTLHLSICKLYVFILGNSALVVTFFLILFAGMLLFVIKSVGDKDACKPMFSRFLGGIMMVFWLIGIIENYSPFMERYVGTYARSFLQHVQVICSALPTCVLICGIICSLIAIYKGTLCTVEMWMIAYLSIITAGLYAILGKYACARYMNLYILGLSALILIVVLELLQENLISKSWCKEVCLLAVIFSLVETVPSSKFSYFIYYPLWSKQNVCRVEPADIESWMTYKRTAGRMIEEYCKDNWIYPGDVTIFAPYGDTWLDNTYHIQVKEMVRIENVTEDMLEEADFWCIDNYSYTGYREGTEYLQEIPIKELEPKMQIKYRNSTVARIYTGDQLRQYLLN